MQRQLIRSGSFHVSTLSSKCMGKVNMISKFDEKWIEALGSGANYIGSEETFCLVDLERFSCEEDIFLNTRLPTCSALSYQQN